MVENRDSLTRFLLPDAHSRGVIFRAEQITAEAARIHGLNGPLAALFGQSLMASILLLSISKGGMRQVLQLDSTGSSPLRRIIVEARNGAVRGYMDWQAEHSLVHHQSGTALSDWLGSKIRLSTVRDLGVGQPYVSTLEHDSAYLADHLMHYLNQSVQIRADIILHGDLAIMIEAMPGCDDDHWFKAVETMAAIPAQALEAQSCETLLEYFKDLRCKIAGSDQYSYRCDCNAEKMAEAIKNMPAEQLLTLVDESGNITVSCQYCDAQHSVRPELPTARH